MNKEAEFTLRKFEPSDTAGVLNLLRLNTPAYFAPEEETDLVNYLHNEAEHYFVMEAEQQLVGCGGFNLLDEGRLARISWDLIHPLKQGKSLGSELLKYRLLKLENIKGIHKIEVRTSQYVWKFYEKNGFVLEETIENYWAPGFDLYRMTYHKK